MKRPLRQTGKTARFVSYEAEPERSVDLRADHPAVVDGHTMFRKSVVDSFSSAVFLVEGKNSPKTGAMVTKGPWAGMPIFTLTLEERATCPRSCAVWAGCYGNSMQWARRNDATDPDFIPALKAEVVTLVRKVCSRRLNRPEWEPPPGIVIRLHILGDFFSTAYIQMWADLLDVLPELHIFGYTARSEDADDAESRRIARAIRFLTDEAWDRFAIRWSRAEPGPQRSVVVTQMPTDPDVIVCPAMTHKTESCATCGLCWAPAARGKTIAFLKHGIKGGRRSPGGDDPPKTTEEIPMADDTLTIKRPTLREAAERLAQFDPVIARALADGPLPIARQPKPQPEA